MTKRDRREMHAWRRCIYCGKFVSYKDLDEGKAKSEFAYTPVYYSEPFEEVEAYHVGCHIDYVKRHGST